MGRTRYTEGMGEQITPSQLRQDIYRIIDRVLETGEPLEINRRGEKLHLTPISAERDRLARIHTNPDVMTCDPEILVTLDWSQEWNAEGQLSP